MQHVLTKINKHRVDSIISNSELAVKLVELARLNAKFMNPVPPRRNSMINFNGEQKFSDFRKTM